MKFLLYYCKIFVKFLISYCQTLLEFCYSFWNEVSYTRVEQRTYSIESETLPLPWPALRYHSQKNTRSSLTVCPCARTHLHCRYAWVTWSRSFLRCRYAWVSLSRSYLRWTNIPEARWQCVRHKRDLFSLSRLRSLVYSHIPALTYDTGSNFNDPCLRTDIWHRFKFQRPMFTTYWFQIFAFRNILNQFLHIWYSLAISFTTKFESQKSNYFWDFAILLSLRKKSKSGPIFATQALLCREFRGSQIWRN